MALICDTGAVYALFDADDSHHMAAKGVVETEAGPLFLPLILLAEIDYLLTTRLGTDAAVDFLESIESGAFTLVAPSSRADAQDPVLIHADVRRFLTHRGTSRNTWTRFP